LAAEPAVLSRRNGTEPPRPGAADPKPTGQASDLAQRGAPPCTLRTQGSPPPPRPMTMPRLRERHPYRLRQQLSRSTHHFTHHSPSRGHAWEPKMPWLSDGRGWDRTSLQISGFRGGVGARVGAPSRMYRTFPALPSAAPLAHPFVPGRGRLRRPGTAGPGTCVAGGVIGCAQPSRSGVRARARNRLPPRWRGGEHRHRGLRELPLPVQFGWPRALGPHVRPLRGRAGVRLGGERPCGRIAPLQASACSCLHL